MVANIFAVEIDESLSWLVDGIDEFKLGQSGIGQRLEAFEMLAADGGQNGIIRRDHPGQFFDFTADIGAHFADKVMEFFMKL